ncbi:MAG: hypothetical protein MUP76_11075 [Acidimicrobiia bacterium]|nr:hypothetical protein [Acidimicrobiia bacterium]
MLHLFQVTDTIVEQGKELVEAAKADPVLLAVLIGVGVITLGIFFWGISKQLFKAAIVAGLLSVGVWYWYFNIR